MYTSISNVTVLALCVASAALVLPAVAAQTADAAAVDTPEKSKQHISESELPMWRKHYLLTNDTVQLEPCSASHVPRAWQASHPSAQGAYQIPGTAAIQALIYAHQHPSNCSAAKFLVFQHQEYLGLGAMLDNLADALAWAMTENRVLLVDYPSPWTRGDQKYSHPSYCHGGALALDECYFEPVSSCSLWDVYGPEVAEAWRRNLDAGALHQARAKLHSDRIIFNTVTSQYDFGQIPPQATAYLDPIRKGVKIGGVMSELFWWRAQGVAYICRLSARTLQTVAEIKEKHFKDNTIAPGTISVHVRRGNKATKQGGEMSYVQEETYHRYVRALQAGSANTLKRAVFISTEDPSALQSCRENMTDWNIQFTTVPRNNHGGQAPFAHAPSIEALRAFLNLDLALECDGWVGTLGSMWSVLMERLRSTVRCKADMPYTDAHGTLAGLGSVRRQQ